MSDEPKGYWDVLADSAKAMDKVEACAECMQHWRNHGPRHYRAFRNVNDCKECAIRTVEVVERAILDWQYEHDPLKTIVRKLVDTFRVVRPMADEDIREVSPERLDERCTALATFWAYMKELDLAVPGRAKEEKR